MLFEFNAKDLLDYLIALFVWGLQNNDQRRKKTIYADYSLNEMYEMSKCKLYRKKAGYTIM